MHKNKISQLHKIHMTLKLLVCEKKLAFLKSVLYNNKALLKEVNIAEWSSPVARRAHNPKVVGSNPASATITGHQF